MFASLTSDAGVEAVVQASESRGMARGQCAALIEMLQDPMPQSRMLSGHR